MIKNILRVLYKTKNYFLEEINTELWKALEGYKLKKFKDIHFGQDCFIIGNGPSLNKTDLTILNNYYTFGLNKIYLINNKVDFRYHYYVAVNGYVIEQSKQEINKLKCPKFISYNAGKNIIDRNTTTYFTKSGREICFQKDICQPVYEGYTVTYVAMQIAYYMGFKNVFLVGIDHSFAQNGSPNSVEKMDGNDPNHFDPNYFKGMAWNLADLFNSEISYFLAMKNCIRSK